MEESSNTPITRALKEQFDVTDSEAREVFEIVLDTVKEELLAGNTLHFKEFGEIKVVERKAEIVKDPETGHQRISPAHNAVQFTPFEPFKKQLAKVRLQSIILAVPAVDPFVQVVEFHFTRVGWRVHLVHSVDECMDMLDNGAYLVIVDHGLDQAEKLIRDIKSSRRHSLVPLILLFPEDHDPESDTRLQVVGDEFLCEPFEVYQLLMLAESELARSSEEEAIFEQQISFQFGSDLKKLDDACALVRRLLTQTELLEADVIAFENAFSEAAQNSIRHGHSSDPQKLVKVLYLLDREKITLVIQDHGTGFNHQEALDKVGRQGDALTAARERKAAGGDGGLGLMMIVKGADMVEYSGDGNILTLTKYLPKQGA